MSVNWGLLQQQPDIAGSFQQGFDSGRARRDKGIERNALAGLVANPGDATQLNALAQVNPQAAMQMQGRQQAAQMETQRRELAQRAASGDGAALQELAGVDPDLWGKIDGKQKEQIKGQQSFMANAYQHVASLPEEQRAQTWGAYVQQAEASGMDIPAQYERYSPEALNAVAASVGTMDKILKQWEPDWTSIAPGGRMVDRNPLTNPTRNGFDGGGGAPSVPDAAIARLRQNPDKAADFDAMFGPGSAARALGGAASQGAGGF